MAPECSACLLPIRYVLNCVYMHCKTGSNYQNIGTGYHVNSGSEVNVYFASTSPSSGLAYNNYVIIGTTGISMFNHELGHIFGLNHAYIEQDFPFGHCDDTDPHLVSWDANCDGVLANGPYKEVDYFCWSYAGQWSVGQSEGDKNQNGIHDCSETAPCSISPCCDWNNINNNVMADNQYQEAFTACQSQFWLENIHAKPNLCAFVEAVGGACAPPAAFITQTAQDKANTNRYCTERLILQASVNEVRHKLEIMLNGSLVVIYSSGWVNGEAQNLKFTTDPSLNPAPGTFLLLLGTGTEYKAVLTVENACHDQDSYTYIFTTPTVNECEIGEADPDPGALLSLAISPNPTTGTVNINFDGHTGESFTVKSVNLLNSNTTTILSNYSATSGNNSLSINVGSLTMSNYALTVQSAQKIYQGHFIKL